jgi:cleavage stimulation factor subunit 3
MTDNEAEAAFFQAQALSTESQAPAEEDADNSDSDDYDPSQALGDQYSTSFPEPKETDDGPTDASAPEEMDDSTHNPAISSEIEADALDPSQNPSRAESQTSTPVPPSGDTAQPKTRTIGGFEVDEDEDEEGDADYEPPAVLEDENDIPVTMSEDPSSGNANQNTSTLDVSSHQAEQGPANGPDLSNSSYSPAHVSNIDPSFVSGQSHWAAQDLRAAEMQNSTAPTPVPDSPSAQGRLVHDRVGILEDRIEEDPRGDIPAWLELIAEHRSRGRLDSARETYERFLKVFPMAVRFVASVCLYSAGCKIANRTPSRPTNGWRMPVWSPNSTNCSVLSRSSTEPS